MSGSDGRLGVQLHVFPRESTRWAVEPIAGQPGRVVLATAGNDTHVTIHLDRVTIKRMQSALEGGLADLEQAYPAA